MSSWISLFQGMLVVAGVILAAPACTESTPTASPAVGEEQGPCDDDGHCDEGLVCASNICVAPPEISAETAAETPDDRAPGPIRLAAAAATVGPSNADRPTSASDPPAKSGASSVGPAAHRTSEGSEESDPFAGMPRASTDDTWSSFARDFFERRCNSCHGPDSVRGDFTRYEVVVEHAARMRCGMAAERLEGCDETMPAPRRFPTGPRPPETELERAIQWLEARAPR